MIRTIIVDDEYPTRQELATILSNISDIEIVAQCAIGQELLDYLQNSTVDIVFLDIEMPGLNGIYVGNELKNKNPNIIIFIVTSYSEYLDDAMRFHVFRYLSKPVDPNRLFRNLKDAIELYNTTVTKIPIETKNGVYTVPASDIVFAETHGHKTIIHTLKQDYESIHSMRHWLEVLKMPCWRQELPTDSTATMKERTIRRSRL